MPHAVELVLDARATLGEGPLWSPRDRVLYWVDIEEGRLHVYDPAAGTNRTLQLGRFVTTVVPCASGGVLVSLQHALAKVDPQTGRQEVVAEIETDRPNNRCNDGKCDPAGRFWVGSMALDFAAGAGGLYCLEKDRGVRRVLDKVTISNGLIWTSDRSTMYYIDTPLRTVDAFDYDFATGAIRNRRTAVKIPDGFGYPDGMTIDAEGMLWVSLWGGGKVARGDPKTGKLLDMIAVPATQVTSCAFGGPDLDTLYITTARIGLDEKMLAAQPLGGGLFRCKPGVKGTEADTYAG